MVAAAASETEEDLGEGGCLLFTGERGRNASRCLNFGVMTERHVSTSYSIQEKEG